MNRRRFLASLLSLPFVPVTAKLLGQLPPPELPSLGGIGTTAGVGRANIVAATIEGRSQQLADCVSGNNLLLMRVQRDWAAERFWKLGDEVTIDGKVLVCVQAGSTSRKRLARATTHLGDYEVINRQGAHVLMGQYLSGTTIWHHDHSRHLIRQMRLSQRWGQQRTGDWPFDNSFKTEDDHGRT